MPIFQPPFPEPTEVESVAVFMHFAILFFLIILIIYCYQKIDDYLPIIAIYGFSLVIGFEAFAHPHSPFSPMFEVFFLIFQTTILVITAFEFRDKRKRKS